MNKTFFEELPARKVGGPVVSPSDRQKTQDSGGGTTEEKSAKKIRQAVYDIRYRARREGIELQAAYNRYMSNTSMSGPEKSEVKKRLFGEAYGPVQKAIIANSKKRTARLKSLLQSPMYNKNKYGEPVGEAFKGEGPDKKYKVRVTDKATGRTYVRYATRQKIAQLRANPNISSVEMTEYGEPYEGEAERGEQTAAVTAGKTSEKEKDEKKKDDVKEAKNGGASKASETKFHKKLDKLVHKTFGKRKEEEMNGVHESHFKVGDEVICKNSGMEGEVVKVGPEEKGKYYTVKREDGKKVKYAPDELKLEDEDENEGMKESLDPVGQEDSDIDNDGDVDKSDKYLHKRRKAIGKAIKKRRVKEDLELSEKAVSKKQQKFMGMVHAVKKGEMKAPSPEVAKAASSITGKEAKKFASTKHKGLPEKKYSKNESTQFYDWREEFFEQMNGEVDSETAKKVTDNRKVNNKVKINPMESASTPSREDFIKMMKQKGKFRDKYMQELEKSKEHLKRAQSEEYFIEENSPTNSSLWSQAKTLAKKKFDVYPSAYANAWASKWYKSKGGSWKSGKGG